MNISVWRLLRSGQVRVGVNLGGGTMHIVEPEHLPALQAALAQTTALLERIGTDAWTEEDQRQLDQEGFSFEVKPTASGYSALAAEVRQPAEVAYSGTSGGYVFVGEEGVAFADALLDRIGTQ